LPSAAPVSRSVPLWFPKAPPLAAPQAEVIRVVTVDELFRAVEHIGAGGTILLGEGHYKLPQAIILQEKKNIIIRSAAGDPTKVTLSGKGWDSEAKGDDILRIARCEGVTIADLTFADCRSYGIKVEAENAPKDICIYNCRFRNIGVRAIKGSAGQDPNVRAVRGSIRYCHFENTKVPPDHWLFGGDYIAAIDMMALEDWTFSDNVFRNIKGRNGGGRAAIFIWVRSRRVVVERNFIINCDRGWPSAIPVSPQQMSLESGSSTFATASSATTSLQVGRTAESSCGMPSMSRSTIILFGDPIRTGAAASASGPGPLTRTS